MANKTTSKPKREIKTGNRGGPRTRLGVQDKILMGKGSFQSLKPIQTTAWQGASSFSEPFDAVQAEKNKLAGFC